MIFNLTFNLMVYIYNHIIYIYIYVYDRHMEISRFMNHVYLIPPEQCIPNTYTHAGWWFGTCFFPFSWECHHPN